MQDANGHEPRKLIFNIKEIAREHCKESMTAKRMRSTSQKEEWEIGCFFWVTRKKVEILNLILINRFVFKI